MTTDGSNCRVAWPVLAPPGRLPIRAIARSAVARPAVAVPAGRIDYIDIARGLFVLWMVAAHALTLAHVPAWHPLQILRPAGWSTVCFVMLSGFGIAMVQSHHGLSPDALRRKLRRRGLQILVIAFVSNLVSAAFTAAVSGSFSLGYLVQVATFRVPWGISGVLVPTGLVALLTPILLELRGRVTALRLLVLFVALNLACDASRLTLPAVRSVLANIQLLFSFPVVSLCLCATATFALAAVVSETRHHRAFLPALVTTLVAAAALLAWRPALLAPLNSVTSIARFTLALGIALAIARLDALGWLRSALRAAGQSALLIFICHRPLLQALTAVLERQAPPAQTAMTLIALGWTACIALGVWRLRAPAVSTALRRFGF